MNKRKGRKEEKKGRKEGKKGREEKVILEGGTYCRGCAGRKKGSRKKGRGKGRKKGEGEKKTAPRQAAPGGARQTGRRDGGRDGKSEVGAFAVPPSISPACLVSQTVQRPFQKLGLSDPLEIWCGGLGSKKKIARSKARRQESKIF